MRTEEELCRSDNVFRMGNEQKLVTDRRGEWKWGRGRRPGQYSNPCLGFRAHSWDRRERQEEVEDTGGATMTFGFGHAQFEIPGVQRQLAARVGNRELRPKPSLSPD